MLDAALAGALTLPIYAAHHLGDHPFQPSTWAAAKGGCDHSGRIACAKHVLHRRLPGRSCPSGPGTGRDRDLELV